MPAPRIAPSVLSADFGRLRELVGEIVDAGASVIHIDVMDGHFVPPLSMGPPVVKALRDLDVLLDVHLMIESPERQIADFTDAGAGQITIHAEATPHVHYTLAAIRDAGCKAGLALNPGTPVGALDGVELDCALIMTVNPGWGGQKFIPTSLDKIRRVRELIGPDAELDHPALGQPFDRVLVDPPCSGLGTLRSNPDLRWRMTPEIVARLVAEQDALVAAARARLRPGGVLVYSTCTINPGEERVRGAVRQQTLPHRDGTDGFYTARE